MSGPFRHRISVRYGEVDQQGVVFNAHYLAYMDDAMETWMREFPHLRQTFGWDMMLKKCTLEWQGSVASGELLDIDVAVTHWGRTSWRLGYVGTCEGRAVFTAEVVYISVQLGSSKAIETPAGVRQAFGEAVDLSAAAAT